MALMMASALFDLYKIKTGSTVSVSVKETLVRVLPDDDN